MGNNKVRHNSDNEEIDDSFYLKLLIFLNWTFAVFSFIGLVLLIVLQLGVSLFISSTDSAQLAPPQVIALGFAYLLPSLVTAVLGIEGFQRGSERILNIHIISNFVFSFLTAIAAGIMIGMFQGSILKSTYSGFIQQFTDFYDELSVDDREGWVDVQNSLSCCASNAEGIFEIGIGLSMTGVECNSFIEDNDFTSFVDDFQNNQTAFLDGILEFNIPFCEEKLSEFLESLVPLFIVLLVLTILSLIFQIIIITMWKYDQQDGSVVRTSFEEEQDVEINIRPTNSRIRSNEEDLLDTGSIIRVKSLAPELKDIYSKNWKMSKKSRAKQSSNEILHTHLEEFEEEEKRQSLKRIEVVKADLPRNQPKRVSLQRFAVKEDDDLMAEINRKETSETLGRVQYETLNTYLVSDDEDEEEEQPEQRRTKAETDDNVSFL